MIKALIFDFAGVITTTDAYWQWISEHAKDAEAKQPHFQKLSEDVDRAHITHEKFIEEVARAMHVPQKNVWSEVKKRFRLNHKLLSDIQRLKEHYKIGLLSNFTYPWLSELLREYNLRGHFDELLISSVEKVIKPNPKIFHMMLSRLSVRPYEAIFWDDKQSNVDGARQLGIHAFLFTTNEKFKNDVEELF